MRTFKHEWLVPSVLITSPVAVTPVEFCHGAAVPLPTAVLMVVAMIAANSLQGLFASAGDEQWMIHFVLPASCAGKVHVHHGIVA